MNIKNPKKLLKTYQILGTSLFGCAGAIVSFVLGGPFWIILGAPVGVLCGYFFHKIITRNLAPSL